MHKSDMIVVAGKGGTGKTTISALLTLYLARRMSSPVLAIDADPNSNLGDALGCTNAGTIAEIVDEVAKNPDIVPGNMGKDAYIEYRIHQDIMENKGFDLVVMGRPEGPGCYCYINNVLRNSLSKLTSDYCYVVIDNEAGLEHFSRKTTRSCAHLLIVSDESEVGLRSAKRIFELVDELKIEAKTRYLFVNKTRGQLKKDLKEEFRVDGIFAMPADERVAQLSAQGKPLTDLGPDSLMQKAVAAAGEDIWPKN